MKIRQFELYDAESRSTLMCWLDDDTRLKPGRTRVTLKGMPHRDWIVMKAYKLVKEDVDLNRRWKVGGLL